MEDSKEYVFNLQFVFHASLDDQHMTRSFERPRKPESHLIHLLASTKNHHPNFVLLLGAGASVESGVKSASEMIKEWRETYERLYGDGTPSFSQKQTWFGSSIEYSYLFETLYDQPTQRREYIESCVENATPSWGYMYLVDLIKARVFNTIFTTNFDDLLNEACYLYSTDVRPIVCAHDSSIRSVRITTKRPKIIKLHGDFLFDSIKNTVRELESLESNMRDKFKQYASEYGMIVLGYSGRDRSIMDTLDALLRNDDSFPHGVYWCVRKGSEVAKEVDHLCRFPRFHLVELSSFNGFMCESHNAITGHVHPIISNPYGVAAEKLANLLESLRAPSGNVELQKCLARDVTLLGTKLQENHAVPGVRMPHQILAWNDLKNGNHEGAIGHIRLELQRVINRDNARLAIDILKAKWSDDLANDLVKSLEKNRFERPQHIGSINYIVVQLLHQKRFEFAERVMNATAPEFALISGWAKEYFLLNRAQNYRHQGLEIPEPLLKEIRKLADSSIDPLARFGAFCCLAETSNAVDVIIEKHKNGLVEDTPLDEILGWPICWLLSEKERSQLLTLAKPPG
jgi:hypothetical protein